MIYELRQYLIDRGRMCDNHDRMRNHTPALLARHGVRVVARWEALAGPMAPSYCYMMEWQDFAEREAAWGGFYADPDWPRIREATNAGSEMVENNNLMFLRPNAIWQPPAEDAGRQIGGLHQMIVLRTAIGKAGAVNGFLRDIWLPRVRAAGAHVIGVLDAASGPTLPCSVILLAWPDEGAWRRGWRAFEADPAMRDAFAEQRRTHGRTLLGPADVSLLEPADYALPLAAIRPA